MTQGRIWLDGVNSAGDLQIADGLLVVVCDFELRTRQDRLLRDLAAEHLLARGDTGVLLALGLGTREAAVVDRRTNAVKSRRFCSA
jgi:hypothetical protein